MNKNFNNSRENLQNSENSPLKDNLNVIFQENDNNDSQSDVYNQDQDHNDNMDL